LLPGGPTFAWASSASLFLEKLSLVRLTAGIGPRGSRESKKISRASLFETQTRCRN
jgi:hypothetical protein